MLFKHKEPSGNQTRLPLVVRGPILDRNGKILAIQTQLNTVTAWTPNLENREETVGLLSEALNLDKNILTEEFQARTGFMYIKRKISPTESKKIETMLAEGKLKGIYLEPEYGRNYPEKNLACHVIGYVGLDNNGLEGIEYTFNDVLSPSVEKKKEIFGNQVFLTLDSNVQYFTERIAKKAYAENNADAVMIFVMDAKTAEILAYVSIPDYDLNNFSEYSQERRKNLPIQMNYEPGSVFKIFSLASILELGGISEHTTFTCNGKYERILSSGEKISIGCLGVHGSVNADKILQFSCNAGAAYASDTVTAGNFNTILRQFGFGEKVGIPLNGESSGSFRSPERWSARSKPTIAIGQEISVTTMQILAAATVFANEGTLLKPHIVKKILSSEGEVLQEFQREPLHKVISKENARKILGMMENAVLGTGTARRAGVEGMRISAKTGTAQTYDPKTGSYSKEAYLASCISFFPTDSPEFVTYTVIVHPKADSYFGGRIAAPVAKEIAEELITYFSLSKSNDRTYEHTGKIVIQKPQPLNVTDVVPDFSGVPKKLLLPLFDRKDITVKIKGDGWVVRQNPPPGTPVVSGMIISLELE